MISIFQNALELLRDPVILGNYFPPCQVQSKLHLIQVYVLDYLGAIPILKKFYSLYLHFISRNLLLDKYLVINLLSYIHKILLGSSKNSIYVM